MDIKQARALKIGGTVYCPADRGELSYHGKVTHISEAVNTAHNGVEYLWITVRKNNKTDHVWPSNRLM